MKKLELRVCRIGNSKGIRIPAQLLRKYRIGQTVFLEEREGELVLRGKGKAKLSWKQTFQEMAKEKEDWNDFEGTIADGLE